MTSTSNPSDSDPPLGQVTQLLANIEAGDDTAPARLLPLVYDQLRAMAQKAFREQVAGNTLQPTVIVHDAYLKLVNHAGEWNDRSHFFVVAAKAMRQLLADHARARKAQKRGGEWNRVSMADMPGTAGAQDLDLVGLDSALNELAALSERQARVVELRFLAGLEVEEVGKILGVSGRTVVSEWRTARAFLRARLESSPS